MGMPLKFLEKKVRLVSTLLRRMCRIKPTPSTMVYIYTNYSFSYVLSLFSVYVFVTHIDSENI